MNRFSRQLLKMAVLFLVTTQGALADPCEPSDTKEVLQAEQTRLSAQMQNNLDTMAQLLDEQLVYVRNSGVVDSKSSSR